MTDNVAVQEADRKVGGNRPPLGSKWNIDGELVPNDEEIRLFEEVRVRREQGHSYRRIATDLSREGWTNRIGNPLNDDNVITIAKRLRSSHGKA